MAQASAFVSVKASPNGSPPHGRTWCQVLSLSLLLGLAACGGGGSATGHSPFPDPDSGGGGGSSGGGSASAAIAQACAPTNPYLADATSATTTGTLGNEKAWLRSYMNQAYLWFDQMPVVDATLYSYSNTSDVYGSLDTYFEALKTPALTASGKRRDQFSFTYPTKAWNDLSQSGTVQGYGVDWYMASPTPPRGLVVSQVGAGTAAASAGLARGDVLVSVDGVSADAGDAAGVDVLNAGLFPTVGGATHSFTLYRDGVGNYTRSLTAGTVVLDPVPLTSVLSSPAGKKVGYILFNDHVAPAEDGLIQAVNTLQTAGVQELVLDLRYNGGGFLYIASELAYMIAGPSRTSGKVFDQLQYNSKRLADTQSADAKTPFYTESCILDSQFNCTRVAALPTLNLSRVVILTSAGTCSASEAIVNGLRGVDVDVRLIGETTCGKPYGFTAKDNCGISYFPIEFAGVNQKGFGDYADGFAATCAAADDFSHALGSPSEGRLALALRHLDTGDCTAPGLAATRRQSLLARLGGSGPQVAGGRPLRGPEREAQVRLPAQAGR